MYKQVLHWPRSAWDYKKKKKNLKSLQQQQQQLSYKNNMISS